MGGEGKGWISWNRWDCWGEGLLHWCVMERAGEGRGGVTLSLVTLGSG